MVAIAIACLAVLALPASSADAPQSATPPSALRGRNTTLGAMASLGAGPCTAADEAAMRNLGSGNAEGTFPAAMAQCGKSSWSFFGGFDLDEFRACAMARAGIGAPCAGCFGAAGQYGYDHCKFSCLFGSWCGRLCLNCMAPAKPETLQCAGVQVPTATQC
mmetsp:Transcript_90660/g.283503  ORF Transcript_90660/g.283503 Transcript_90660/m.283503 type:complete len:161 (+) Transcript_90660:74-556(+)